MRNTDHVRRQNRFTPLIVDRLFVIPNAQVCRLVNAEKDCKKGKDHRVDRHGFLSNIPFLRKYGIRGFKAGVQHDLDDIRHSFGNPSRSKIETVLGEINIASKRWHKRVKKRRLFLY